MNWPAREQYDQITATAEKQFTPPPPPAHPRHKRALTNREIQILQLVAEGKTNTQIAEDLGISRLTVKSHLQRIGDTIHATRREHMVMIALRSGLID